MLIYAESSAVLAWMLDQAGASEVGSLLANAKEITCSALTILECERVLFRGVAGGRFSPAERENFEKSLHETSRTWSVSGITPEVLAAARRPFLREPVRALDAIHLGTALHLRRELPALAFLSIDRRVAENAALLGFEVLPRGGRDR